MSRGATPCAHAPIRQRPTMLDKKQVPKQVSDRCFARCDWPCIGPTVGLTKFETKGLIVMHPAIVERRTTK